MATSVVTSVGEYLSRSYRPDQELLEGQLVERNEGDYDHSRLQEPVLTLPPVVCIDVLSKDDTLRSWQERIDDYRAFGVPNIWVLDPVKRRAYVCQQGDFRESDSTLKVPLSPISIPLADLFAFLD